MVPDQGRREASGGPVGTDSQEAGPDLVQDHLSGPRSPQVVLLVQDHLRTTLEEPEAGGREAGVQGALTYLSSRLSGVALEEESSRIRGSLVSHSSGVREGMCPEMYHLYLRW